jgi:transposase, IS30 family
VTHSHLSQAESYQIENLLSEGLSISQIAARLGRHRSTVYRECKRCAGSYAAQTAREHRQQCAGRSNANAPRYQHRVWAVVRKGLDKCWSPQQVAGRAKLQGQRCPSWQAIYDWSRRVWPERSRRPLRRAQTRKRTGLRGWVKRANPIAQRPPEIRQRLELGHWETDTMLGAQTGRSKRRLLVSVERVSLFTRLALLPNALPQTVAAHFKRTVLDSKLWPMYTLTVDQGGEFAQLPELLGPALYACDPGCPNQRGSNENLIGLVRQYIPKGRALSSLSVQEVSRIEQSLNDRPRACLGFRTPKEVLFAQHHRCRVSN